jgi:hypothetical protein
MIKVMKTTNYQHDALINYDPKTGEYNEEVNDDGIIQVTAAYQVCPECDGHGHHFRSDLDENHLLNMMEEDGDYEGIESYHRGRFDQVCDTCEGQRVVLKYDLPEWADKLVYEWWMEESLSRRISDAERRMGA